MRNTLLFIFSVLILSSCKNWQTATICLEDGFNFSFYNCWTHPFLNEGERKVIIKGKTYYLPTNTGGCDKINIYRDEVDGEQMLILQDKYTLTTISLSKKCIYYSDKAYDFDQRKAEARYCGRIEIEETIQFITADASEFIELNGKVQQFI